MSGTFAGALLGLGAQEKTGGWSASSSSMIVSAGIRQGEIDSAAPGLEKTLLALESESERPCRAEVSGVQ